MGLGADRLLLYLVTDPDLCRDKGLIATVLAAVRGGATLVQLRDKHSRTDDRIAMARALKDELQGTGVPLVINDDLEAAIAADADGVHIGQDDIDPAEARAKLGAGKIIGLSCETPQQVRMADAHLVDYLGLGTVFPTSSKHDHKPTIGLSGLAAMARLSPLPTVAIGGLKAGHAQGVLDAGCDGMAVVSAICGQPDPETAARDLIGALTTAKERAT